MFERPFLFVVPELAGLDLRFEEILSAYVLQENVLTTVASAQDMINGSRG